MPGQGPHGKNVLLESGQKRRREPEEQGSCWQAEALGGGVA